MRGRARHPGSFSGGESNPHTRNVFFYDERNIVLGRTNTFGGYSTFSLTNRSAGLLAQFRTRGWCPTVVAPSFNQHGGRVAPGFKLMMSAPAGAIYYNTKGVDPRVYGSSAVSLSDATYLGGTIPLVATTVMNFISLTRTSVFTINNMRSNDAASYRVVAGANVTFNVGAPVTSSFATLALNGPPRLSDVVRLLDGSVRFNLTGTPNRTYTIEATSNLTNWVNVGTLGYTNGVMPFVTHRGRSMVLTCPLCCVACAHGTEATHSISRSNLSPHEPRRPARGHLPRRYRSGVLRRDAW